MDWTIPGILNQYGRHLDAAMRAMFEKNVLPEAGQQIIEVLLQNPGKRIRPALVLGTHVAFGGNAEEALPLAAVVEWIHTASLIHDDIEDLDHFRRGAPSIWSRFGVPYAINAGDQILASALAHIANTPWPSQPRLKLLQRVLLELERMTIGQQMDLELERKSVSFEQYAKLCSGKTGAIFRVCFVGPVLLICPQNQRMLRYLEDVGTRLGELFQRRDDLVDVVGKKEGRPQGNDLFKGRTTCLVAHASQLLQGRPRDTFFALYAQNTGQRTVETVRQMYQILMDEGVVHAAIEAWRSLSSDFSQLCHKRLPSELAYLLDDLRQRLEWKEAMLPNQNTMESAP